MPIKPGVPVLLTLLVMTLTIAAPLEAAQRQRVQIRSSSDGSMQPSYIILPEDYSKTSPPAPLLVSLHSWSGDVEQRHHELERLAAQQQWVYLFPHFRGPNDDPDACGSALAQQDILDAVDWVCSNYPIDSRRIYLTGTSGGGHMTMLMAALYPQRWAAASAWVGISDLAAWHARHADGRYGAMLRQVCGGPPGASPEVDAQYRARSPLTHLAGAAGVPLDIAAGIHDGHQGSVPIRHSLEAFNVIARAVGAEPVADDEIEALSRPDGRLAAPQESDRVIDPSYERAIYLRRHADKARVTIFEGGHEGLPAAAIDFLRRFQR